MSAVEGGCEHLTNLFSTSYFFLSMSLYQTISAGEVFSALSALNFYFALLMTFWQTFSLIKLFPLQSCSTFAFPYTLNSNTIIKIYLQYCYFFFAVAPDIVAGRCVTCFTYYSIMTTLYSDITLLANVHVALKIFQKPKIVFTLISNLLHHTFLPLWFLAVVVQADTPGWPLGEQAAVLAQDGAVLDRRGGLFTGTQPGIHGPGHWTNKGNTGKDIPGLSQA